VTLLVGFAIFYLLLSNIFITNYHLPIPMVADSSVHYSTVLWLQNGSVGCFVNGTTKPYPHLLWHEGINFLDGLLPIPLPWIIAIFNLAMMVGIFILIYLVGKEYDKEGGWFIGIAGIGVGAILIKGAWLILPVFLLGFFSLYLIMKFPQKDMPKQMAFLSLSVFIMVVIAETIHSLGGLFVIAWVPILLARNELEKKLLLEMTIVILFMVVTLLFMVNTSDAQRLMIYPTFLLSIFLWKLIEKAAERIKNIEAMKETICLIILACLIVPNLFISAYLLPPYEPEFVDILSSYHRGDLTSDSYVALYDSKVDDNKGNGYGCPYLVSYARAHVEIIGKNPSHLYEPVLRAHGGFTAWDEWSEKG